MLKVQQNIERENIKEVLTHPRLFNLTYGQAFTEQEFNCFNLEEKEDFIYLEVLWGSEVAGAFQLLPLNRTTLSAHIAIHPRHWGTELPIEAVKQGLSWIKNNMLHRTIFVQVPLSCRNVHKFMERIEFKCCGNIPNGVIHNNLLQDLVLYTKHIED